MSKLSLLGDRQQQLLRALLNKRGGMTVDELANNLAISRNAINQHLSSLEAAGFVAAAAYTSTRGRPSRLYQLTPYGLEAFPKHYSLISLQMIQWMRDKLGEKQLSACMQSLGAGLAEKFSARVAANTGPREQMQAVASIMQELGYEARLSDTEEPEIIATNCVFHQLAEECEQVCQLDLALLSGLLETEVEHRECMVRGGVCCRFAPVKTR